MERGVEPEVDPSLGVRDVRHEKSLRIGLESGNLADSSILERMANGLFDHNASRPCTHLGDTRRVGETVVTPDRFSFSQDRGRRRIAREDR
jgi:hypothetical protein